MDHLIRTQNAFNRIDKAIESVLSSQIEITQAYGQNINIRENKNKSTKMRLQILCNHIYISLGSILSSQWKLHKWNDWNPRNGQKHQYTGIHWKFKIPDFKTYEITFIISLGLCIWSHIAIVCHVCALALCIRDSLSPKLWSLRSPISHIGYCIGPMDCVSTPPIAWSPNCRDQSLTYHICNGPFHWCNVIHWSAIGAIVYCTVAQSHVALSSC